MSATPAERAEIDQFLAENRAEVDGLIKGARRMRVNNRDVSREERLTAMAATILNDPDMHGPEGFSNVVFWFVEAIDRLANGSTPQCVRCGNADTSGHRCGRDKQ